MSNFHEAQKAAAGEADVDPMAAFQGYATVDGVRQEPVKPANNAPKQPTRQQAAADEGEGEGEGDGDDSQQNGDGEGDEGRQQQQNKPKNDPQKRINKAIRAQREAERARDAQAAELSALKERLARLEGSTANLTQNGKPVNVDPNAPDPSKYEFGEADVGFIRDLARYEARKEFEAKAAEERNKTLTAQQQKQQEEFQAKKDEFAEKGSAKFDDFDEVVIDGAVNGDWPLSPTLGELLFSSDHGPDIAYALASDVKEATRVYKLTPAQQAAWFGRKEAELSSSTQGATGEGNQRSARGVSQAPEPIARAARGAGGSKPVTADTTDFAAFERMATAARK